MSNEQPDLPYFPPGFSLERLRELEQELGITTSGPTFDTHNARQEVTNPFLHPSLSTNAVSGGSNSNPVAAFHPIQTYAQSHAIPLPYQQSYQPHLFPTDFGTGGSSTNTARGLPTSATYSGPHALSDFNQFSTCNASPVTPYGVTSGEAFLPPELTSDFEDWLPSDLPLCVAEDPGSTRSYIRIWNPKISVQIAVESAPQVDLMLDIPPGTTYETLRLHLADNGLTRDYYPKRLMGLDGRIWSIRLLDDTEIKRSWKWTEWERYRELPGDADKVTTWKELNPVSGHQIQVDKASGRGIGVRIVHRHKPELDGSTGKDWMMTAWDLLDAVTVMATGQDTDVINKLNRTIRESLKLKRNESEPRKDWLRIQDKYFVRRLGGCEEWKGGLREQNPHLRSRWVAYEPWENDLPIDESDYSDDPNVLSYTQYDNSLRNPSQSVSEE